MDKLASYHYKEHSNFKDFAKRIFEIIVKTNLWHTVSWLPDIFDVYLYDIFLSELAQLIFTKYLKITLYNS